MTGFRDAYIQYPIILLSTRMIFYYIEEVNKVRLYGFSIELSEQYVFQNTIKNSNVSSEHSSPTSK